MTAEQAQYAIDNIKGDYLEAALKSAKNYQETMSMSKDAIYNQLVSEYGEKLLTPEEAQYAIDNLDE
ncbi:Ltp family lipoprotein [uncultured Holdemanella sp.]|uniref:Ltp family lipoprotein n=1 Tax=uncultured Holdemanella sp. TaxID=1763549 RepID=UPI00258344DC|nr:Ltp family lipoprotein [uncultured Holdemanella sp.]